jgi:isopentenyldiphosphate isomerase
VREELGIECQLSELGKFTSPKWKMGRLVEWEHITVFAGVADNPKIALSGETEEGRFLPPSEFKSLVERQPGIFTPDTLLALKYCPIVL